MWSGVEMDRCRAAAIALLACLAAALLSSARLAWELGRLRESYEALMTMYQDLSSRCGGLLERYSELAARYSELREAYSRLRDEYEGLRSRYEELAAGRRDLLAAYEALKRNYTRLAESYEELRRLNEELERKLRELEAEGRYRTSLAGKVEPGAPEVVAVVAGLTGGWDGTEEDYWRDAYSLYSFVRSFIGYEEDPVVCRVESLTYATLPSGDRVLADFTCSRVRDYFRSATETLREGAGDCEDQAVLLYSLLLCYQARYSGPRCELYLLEVYVSRLGERHFLVLLVSGASVALLDPASGFCTAEEGRLVTESCSAALDEYAAHWGSEVRCSCLYGPSGDVVATFSSNEGLATFVAQRAERG